MNDENRSYPAKSKLILRTIGGLYLVYLAWGLRNAVMTNTGLAQIGFGFAVFLFAGVGGALAAVSVLAIMKGKYAENFEVDSETAEDIVENEEEK